MRKNVKQQLALRVLSTAALMAMVSSIATAAFADTYDLNKGSVTVETKANGVTYVTQKDDKQEDGFARNKNNEILNEHPDDTGVTITSGGEKTSNTITVETAKDQTTDVTLDNVHIEVDTAKTKSGAIEIKGDGDTNLELNGNNTVLVKNDWEEEHAAIEKADKYGKEGTLTIKDDNGKDGSLTAEGGDDGAGIGGGIGSTGSSITIRGGTIEAVGGAGAAGIGDGVGAQQPEIDQDTPPSNPNNIIICGDAEVTAKAGRSQMLDAKAPAIGGKYGEVPTENLSDEEHKVTGGRLTRLNADGTVMEGMGYDYTSTPTPQPDDDDDDVPPPAQENAPEPLPGGMVVGGFFSSRVTIRRLDPAGVAESGIVPVFGSVKAADARADLTPGDVVLIESAAPRSTVTTDISSLREDGVEDIFFRYEDTMTHYSVDKMADAAGEDADVELKQNREDISLRLDGETRDDLSERYLEWVPVQTPEPQERLILTHEGVEQKTSEELRRERDELRKQELDMMDFQLAKKRDDLPSLDWWLEPAREETVEQKTSEELRRELDELRKQELEMGFQFAKKRDDRPSLDWWLEPARTETPRIGLEESLKQLASRFEDIAPEEDKKPLLVLVEPSGTERKKYINPLESDLRRYTDLSDDWDDQPDTQGEIKIWIPEDLGQPKEISILKESLSRSDGIA